mmetsp:Transcript_77271/g.226614  ORF Transcript_77271/g.226614 Transcript_77271/m.226614 type:complete len:449 (+) Transcript_77271:152-1498(+)
MQPCRLETGDMHTHMLRHRTAHQGPMTRVQRLRVLRSSTHLRPVPHKASPARDSGDLVLARRQSWSSLELVELLSQSPQQGHQASLMVIATVLLGLRRPTFDHLLDPRPPYTEVLRDHLLELSRRSFQNVDHGPPHAVLAHSHVVLSAPVFALLRANLSFKARLVKVGVWDEDERLDGHKHLEHFGVHGVPALSLVTLPRPEEGEAHLARFVEVRVEGHRVVAGGQELHLRGLRGILRREVDVEDEAASAVGRVVGARDEHAPELLPVRTDAHEDGGGARQRQQRGEPRELLGEPHRSSLRGYGLCLCRAGVGMHRAPLALVQLQQPQAAAVLRLLVGGGRGGRRGRGGAAGLERWRDLHALDGAKPVHLIGGLHHEMRKGDVFCEVGARGQVPQSHQEGLRRLLGGLEMRPRGFQELHGVLGQSALQLLHQPVDLLEEGQSVTHVCV